MAVYWGIAGTGLIAYDFASSLQHLGSEKHVISAVASKNLKDSEDFAQNYAIPSAYDCYKQLAENPNVDVVYVAVIHTLHYSVAKMMLEHGKHVLCEKTLCMNVEDTKDLVQLARQKNLFLMEAIWSRCFPIYQRVQEMISDGTLGQIIQVNATFGKSMLHVPRLVEKNLGGGVLFDIGVYVIQIASLAFGQRKPVTIKAVGDITKDGVDLCASIGLAYEDGAIASLSCTIKANLTNNAFIVGTKGTIEIKEPFWSPTAMVLPDQTELECKLPRFNRPVNYGNCEGLVYEAEEVRRCVKLGLNESPLFPLHESISIAEIIEEVRRQIGAY